MNCALALVLGLSLCGVQLANAPTDGNYAVFPMIDPTREPCLHKYTTCIDRAVRLTGPAVQYAVDACVQENNLCGE